MSTATLVSGQRANTGIYSAKLGMWVFIASEIMFFSGFFGAFIVLRNLHIDMFHESAMELDRVLGTVNTAILISSSLTMALAHLALENGKEAKFRLYLGLTILASFGFLAVKTIEYTAKFHHGIGPHTNVFFASYFLTTGFHATHVIAGMIPMIWIFFRSMTKGYPQQLHYRIETLGLYWHFVDLVWIFLFPTLYLIT